MKFGECYKVLEEGGFVSRTSWNGVFIWLKQKAMVKSEWCKDPVLKMLADANGGEIEAEQVLCKYSKIERKIMTGWSPQQDDLAADDWVDAYVKIENDKLDIKTLEKKSNSDYIGDLFADAEIFKKP